MELFETTLSLGIHSYFKHQKKKSSQEIHFLKSNDPFDQQQMNILLTHHHLSHFRFLIQNMLNEKNIKMNHPISIDWTLDHKISFDYFYIFFHKSICVYFFGKNGINHIFFEGLHKISDFKNINIIQWIQKRKLIQNNALFQKGTLLHIQHCQLNPILQNDFLSVFLFLQKQYNPNHQKIIIEGYSLGGIYLQLFIQLLDHQQLLSQFEFEAYQTESWFQGSEKEYIEFCQKIKMTNIMKYGSYFHLYNSLFQKYRKINSFLNVSKETEDLLKTNAPFRIIEYGIISHML